MDEVIEPTKYKFDSVFLVVTKAFIVLTTVFLIIGISYSIGVDSGFGVNTAIPSTEVSTLLGFFMFFGVIGDVFNTLFSGVINSWVVILSTIFAMLGICILLSLAFSRSKRLKVHEGKLNQALDRLSFWSGTGSAVLLLIAFLIAFPISSFTTGQQYSKSVIEQLRDYGCSRSYKGNSDWSLCTEVFVNGASILKGYMIYRKNNEVAFITLEKQELIIRSLPDKTIFKRLRVE
ncbi:MAG: hypothetical protein VX100_03230 [Pseudomonadota bacterium]|nr:hypothetical protein [Pseudomonadota bacterium]